MPCPNGVDIPRGFDLYNRGLMYDSLSSSRWSYANVMPEENRAKECIQCRECEEKCTQGIEISTWMAQVHAVLGEGQAYPAKEG
jgi:predicted aldo/keto reductase-like oxidoreductase